MKRAGLLYKRQAFVRALTFHVALLGVHDNSGSRKIGSSFGRTHPKDDPHQSSRKGRQCARVGQVAGQDSRKPFVVFQFEACFFFLNTRRRDLCLLVWRHGSDASAPGGRDLPLLLGTLFVRRFRGQNQTYVAKAEDLGSPYLARRFRSHFRIPLGQKRSACQVWRSCSSCDIFPAGQCSGAVGQTHV